MCINKQSFVYCKTIATIMIQLSSILYSLFQHTSSIGFKINSHLLWRVIRCCTLHCINSMSPSNKARFERNPFNKSSIIWWQMSRAVPLFLSIPSWFILWPHIIAISAHQLVLRRVVKKIDSLILHQTMFALLFYHPSLMICYLLNSFIHFCWQIKMYSCFIDCWWY